VIIKELAGCVIYDEEGKLLVLHRNTPNLVQWELPGGKIEEGEEAANAAVREISEELLIDVEIIRKLGHASFEGLSTTWNYTWFEATIIDGVPVVGEPSKFDAVGYVAKEDLAKRKDISPNLVNLLKVIA
jgi:8-oxo-dGTP diphosphatase